MNCLLSLSRKHNWVADKFTFLVSFFHSTPPRYTLIKYSPSFPSSSASFVNTTEEYEQIHTCRPFTVLLECTHFANRLTHPNGNTGDQSNSRDSGQQSSTRPISKHPGYCICPFQHCTDGQSTVQPVYCILDQQQSEQYQRDLVGRMMCTGIHVNQTKEMDHTGHGLDDSMNTTIRTSQDYVWEQWRIDLCCEFVRNQGTLISSFRGFFLYLRFRPHLAVLFICTYNK